MEKFHKSQCAKIVLIVLLLVSPLLMTSMRPLYLYLLFNLLILALGAESGVLGAISRPPSEERKPAGTTVSVKPLDYKELMTAPVPRALEEETAEVSITSAATEGNVGATLGQSQPPSADTSAKAVQRSASEKAKQAPMMAAKIGQVVNKCSSMPSLFFIDGYDGDEEAAEEDEEEEVEEVGVRTKQELFAKAEKFIGNFHKQLKIQREDSWKRIHGLYQEAL